MRADGILLPPAAMAEVDRAAIASGLPGPWLMENAGRAVTRAITARFAPRPTLVLCGPGNNGGDGWVVARQLHRAGWPVRVATLVAPAALRGDAAWAAARWAGEVEDLSTASLGGAELIVDALFGAGLTRPLGGIALAVVEALAASDRAVVAIDVPSGVDGATGAILGAAPRAGLTVTFCRLKPGHLLLPGRLHCGTTRLADIGITDPIVAAHDTGLRANGPALWRHLLPVRGADSHKYRFGHAVVVGGPVATTGAARLASMAALRVGAGLVSIACPPGALTTYAAQLTTVMTKPVAGASGLSALLADLRYRSVLLGPGAGIGEATREMALAALAADRPTVLDADALTSFADDRSALFAALSPQCVLTPHDGEFARLFAVAGDRLSRALAASATSRAVVLLKGSDTVVAAPDRRAAIQPGAPPALATAGTGDVLAGLIVGLLAQGMPAFEAAAAAVWLHAEAARRAGPGMIAEDLAQHVASAVTASRTSL
jgi:ADP-dependent NAD(P)H-hydrate dehydratase / NAD(P)H-hydrate epimerase